MFKKSKYTLSHAPQIWLYYHYTCFQLRIVIISIPIIDSYCGAYEKYIFQEFCWWLYWSTHDMLCLTAYKPQVKA